MLLSIALLVAAQTSTPRLGHSAPFIGQTLSIRLEGAPPSAAIDLLVGPQAGSTVTPYGTLELARGTFHEAASGVASASGEWSVDLPLPLDTSLAEAERHFQAFVDDPSAPAGRVLSDAIHLRLLGPRVYAATVGRGSPARAGLEILSGTTETVVARVEYGLQPYGFPAKPAFDASYSRGAIMSTPRELVLFDPFFGGVELRVPFGSDCSPTLITDAAGASVFVLETGSTGFGRVHAIDFASGAETASLDLPNPVYAMWCEGATGVEAFVAEMDLAGQTSIRLVRLDPLADLGSAVVGTSLEDRGFATLVYAAGQVFASTTEWQDPKQNFYSDGCVTRCRPRGSTIRTTPMRIPLRWVNILTPVPDVDQLLATWHLSFSPGGGISRMPLSVAGPEEVIPSPPTNPDYYPRLLNVDGKTVWTISANDEDATSILFRLDVETLAWTRYPEMWVFDPPGASELMKDAWDHELWIANRPNPVIGIGPEIRIVDELTSTTRRVPLDRMAIALHAVPLP